MYLTDEQVAQEVGFIDMEHAWPLWPILPMKNIGRGDPGYPEDRTHGIICAIDPLNGGETESPTRRIYFISLLNVKTDDVAIVLARLTFGESTGEPFADIPSEDFENTEALVRAGWIGD